MNTNLPMMNEQELPGFFRYWEERQQEEEDSSQLIPLYDPWQEEISEDREVYFGE